MLGEGLLQQCNVGLSGLVWSVSGGSRGGTLTVKLGFHTPYPYLSSLAKWGVHLDGWRENEHLP